MNSRFLLVSFLIILTYSLLLNFTNLSFILRQPDNTRNTVYSSTIFSPDNYWYINFALNLEAGNGYVQYKNSPVTAVRRTPVYPLFYYAHLKLFGFYNSFKVIRITQSIIFAISALFLGISAYNFTNNLCFGKLVTIFYGFNPVISSFCFFTITESLYPALVCFFLYFVSKPKSNYYLFLTGLSGSLLILTRPLTIIVMVTVVLSFFVFEWIERKNLNRWILKYFYFLFGCSVLILPWMIRNYIVTKGDIVFLEKYYDDHVTEQGRDLLYLAKWAGSWSNPDDIEGGYANKIRYYNDLQLFSARDSFSSQWINSLPEEIILNNGKEKILATLNEYNNCQDLKQRMYKKYQGNKSFFDIERSVGCDEMVKAMFINLMDDIRKNNPFLYYIKTPFMIFKELTFHSFSTNFLYLNTAEYKNSLTVKAIKSIMYMLNVSLLLSAILLFIIGKRKNIFLITLVCQIFTYIFLAYSNRRAEVRYILQLYPLLYLSFVYLIMYLTVYAEKTLQKIRAKNIY